MQVTAAGNRVRGKMTNLWKSVNLEVSQIQAFVSKMTLLQAKVSWNHESPSLLFLKKYFSCHRTNYPITDPVKTRVAITRTKSKK